MGNDHSQVFRTWSYETKEPLSLEALRETARKLPASIYRCKGVVHTAEEPGRRVILQVVGKRVDIAVGDEWNGREPRSRIVAIGAHDGVDGAALREVFDRCRDATPHQAKQPRPVLLESCRRTNRRAAVVTRSLHRRQNVKH